MHAAPSQQHQKKTKERARILKGERVKSQQTLVLVIELYTLSTGSSDAGTGWIHSGWRALPFSIAVTGPETMGTEVEVVADSAIAWCWQYRTVDVKCEKADRACNEALAEVEAERRCGGTARDTSRRWVAFKPASIY